MRHDEELIAAAKLLIARRQGQRGKLPGARVRRSISTAYYALFHFLLDEAGRRLVGAQGDLRRRRRTLARVFTHKGLKLALDRVAGANVHTAALELLRSPGAATGEMATPRFARDFAEVFTDAYARRLDADYDLNEPLTRSDAELVIARVERAIAAWQAADSLEDQDFKTALCMLMLLKGQVRPEA